jgi:hypothetical protein
MPASDTGMKMLRHCLLCLFCVSAFGFGVLCMFGLSSVRLSFCSDSAFGFNRFRAPPPQSNYKEEDQLEWVLLALFLGAIDLSTEFRTHMVAHGLQTISCQSANELYRQHIDLAGGDTALRARQLSHFPVL